MYKDNGIWTKDWVIKSTCEKLIMGSVDGIATLKGNNINVSRQRFTNLVQRILFNNSGYATGGNLRIHRHLSRTLAGEVAN
jgi:hypothetical protein